MIALFDKIDRRKIAVHNGEYGKIRKEWKELQTATKSQKLIISITSLVRWTVILNLVINDLPSYLKKV